METSSICSDTPTELPAYCADTIDNTLRTSAPEHIVITTRYDDDAVDFTPSLESIRLRLGDVATCKHILEKTKIDMLSALESLHLNAGDLPEYNSAKKFIGRTLPAIKKANVQAERACKISVELLNALKNLVPETHASPPVVVGSETKDPDDECLIQGSTSLSQCLSAVQAATKKAIIVVENSDAHRFRDWQSQKQQSPPEPQTKYRFFVFPLSAPLFFVMVFVFLPLWLVLSCKPVIIEEGAVVHLKVGERERALCKDVRAALKRVDLISTHIASLHLEEKVKSELEKTSPTSGCSTHTPEE